MEPLVNLRKLIDTRLLALWQKAFHRTHDDTLFLLLSQDRRSREELRALVDQNIGVLKAKLEAAAPRLTAADREPAELVHIFTPEEQALLWAATSKLADSPRSDTAPAD